MGAVIKDKWVCLRQRVGERVHPVLPSSLDGGKGKMGEIKGEGEQEAEKGEERERERGFKETCKERRSNFRKNISAFFKSLHKMFVLQRV